METTAAGNPRGRVGDWIESRPIQNFIIAVIVFNAFTLGLETFQTVKQNAGALMLAIERVVLTIFVVEILLKLYAFGFRFFRNGWNVFDFVIVGIALVPASGPFAILRALRILRVLRLLTKIDRLRHIVESLMRAIPSIGWIALLLGMVFYIFAVIGTELFGQEFPKQFGHLGLSLFSLFQVMTLESWAVGFARPIMEAYPLAWLYFISFILISAFTVLNLFIGIIVNAMQEKHYEEEEAKRIETETRAHAEREEMLRLIRELHEKVDRLETARQSAENR